MEYKFFVVFRWNRVKFYFCFKALQNQLDEKFVELSGLKLAASNLNNFDSDPSAKADVDSKILSVEQPFDELKRKLDSCLASASVPGRVRSIRDDISQLAQFTKGLESEFASLGPLARDLDNLKSQKIETEDFAKSLTEKKSDFDKVENKIDDLRGDGYEADADNCAESLVRTKDQLTALEQQAAKRLSDVDKFTDELATLFDDIGQTHSGIIEVLGSDVLQKPMSGDLQGVRNQMSAIKV